jgi:hypothetical protein
MESRIRRKVYVRFGEGDTPHPQGSTVPTLQFDPDVFQAVWDTPLAGELPTALLYHLPEWVRHDS